METNARQLWFSSRMDNTQLKADSEKTKTSLKEIGDTAKVEGAKIESAFDQASQNGFKSFNGMTTNLKQQIQLQQQLIREISADIRNYQNQLSTTINPKQKESLEGEIAGGKRALVEANGQLLAMQRQQVEGSLKEVGANESLIGSLGKWALGLASVAGAMEIGKKIINSTKESADQFGFAVSAAENGLSYFWKTLATGDFSSFFTNMRKAIEVGYEYARMMDAAKEASWAQSMAEAAIAKENAQLEIDMRDRTKSDKERLEAGQKRIQNEDKLATGRHDVAQKEYDAAVKIAVDRSKLDEKTLIGVLSMIDKTTRAKAEAYNEDLKQKKKYEDEAKKQGYTSAKVGAEGGDTSFDLTKAANDLDAKLKSAPAEVALLAQALRGYGGLKEEMVTNVVNTFNKLGQADASAITGTKRIRTTVNGIQETINKDAEAAEKKAKHDAELDSRIKVTEDLLKHANDQERDAIAERLVLLLQEKSLIDAKNNSAKAMASNKPLETRGAYTWEEAIRTEAKAGGIDLDNLKLRDTGLEIGKINKGITERNRLVEKGERDNDRATNSALRNAQRVGTSFTEQIKMLKEAFSNGTVSGEAYYNKLAELQAKQAAKRKEDMQAAMQELSGIISKEAEKLGLDEKQTEVLQTGLKAMGQLAKGDIIGFVGTAVTTAIDSLIAVPEKLSKRFAEVQQQVQKFIQSLSIANEALKNITPGYNTDDRSLALLQSKITGLTKDASDLSKALDKTFFGKQNATGQVGSLASYYGEARAQIEALEVSITSLSQRLLGVGLSDDQRTAIEAVLLTYNDLKASIDTITQDLTGTTVKNLSNSIAEIFWNGTDAAQEWGKVVNDIIKNVIMNQLTASLIAKPIQAAIDQLVKDSQSGTMVINPNGDPNSRTNGMIEIDKGLSTVEALKFKTSIAAITAEAAPAIEAAKKAMQEAGLVDNGSTRTAATKGIASMSQDTGNELNGRFTAIQGHTFDISQGMKILQGNSEKALQHLAGIETNTFRLEAIENKMEAIKNGIDNLNIKGIKLI